MLTTKTKKLDVDKEKTVLVYSTEIRIKLRTEEMTTDNKSLLSLMAEHLQ